jgi:hypothetical protein
MVKNSEQIQQIQSIEMLGLHRENCLIKILGLIEFALSVQEDCLLAGDFSK